MQVVFKPVAREDVIKIGDFIKRDNPKAAIAFVERLYQRCQDLAQFPNVGRKRGAYRTVTEGDFIIFLSNT